ncbi:DNA replication protein psf2 [Rhizina undulata]
MLTQRPETSPLMPAEDYLPAFQSPQRFLIPLWLALLLKQQKRCNILAPYWLTSANIEQILNIETESQGNLVRTCL